MACQYNALLRKDLHDASRISDTFKAPTEGVIGCGKLYAAREDFFVAFSVFVDTLYGPERWSTGPSTGLEVEKAWGVRTKP